MVNYFKALGALAALRHFGFTPLQDYSFYWSRAAALRGADDLARRKGRVVVATYGELDGDGVVIGFPAWRLLSRPMGLSTGKFSWWGPFTA